MRIAIIACRQYPDLSLSNRVYEQALRQEGADPSVVLWNAAAPAQLLDYDLCVFRQSWDYQDDPAGFAAWVCDAARQGARLANAAHLVVWNNDKRTLRATAAAGLATPEMIDVGPDGKCPFDDASEWVLKPAFGGSGIGVRRCTADSFDQALAEARADAPGRPFFAQAFLPAIADGEWSVTCIDGEVAHTVRRVPQPGDYRTNGRFKPSVERVDTPQDLDQSARAVLEWLRPRPLYVRIDEVMVGERFVCTELELTDPDLNFHWAEDSAHLMARATLRFARAS